MIQPGCTYHYITIINGTNLSHQLIYYHGFSRYINNLEIVELDGNDTTFTADFAQEMSKGYEKEEFRSDTIKCMLGHYFLGAGTQLRSIELHK